MFQSPTHYAYYRAVINGAISALIYDYFRASDISLMSCDINRHFQIMQPGYRRRFTSTEISTLPTSLRVLICQHYPVVALLIIMERPVKQSALSMPQVTA